MTDPRTQFAAPFKAFLTSLDLPHSIYKHDKPTTITGLHWLRRNESSHDIDSLLADVNNIHCYVRAASRCCFA
jgi:hypothetical protein